MESVHHIKSRIKAVSNVGQITKAMEVVAATKMRRSQEVALRSRPYAFGALELLSQISRVAPLKNELAESRPVKNTLFIIVASDKGLTGSFNAQVLRLAEKILTSNFCVAAVGKKATAYAEKKKFKIAGNFHGFGDFINPDEVMPLAEFAIEGFRSGKWDKVVAISTHFRTALLQETLTRQILPVDFGRIRETIDAIVPERGRFAEAKVREENAVPEEYIFEPSPAEALNFLIPQLVKMQIYHLILEANASEHSARRVAMKTASDNAEKLSGELNLIYNKARQSGITKEIIEITSTLTALS